MMWYQVSPLRFNTTHSTKVIRRRTPFSLRLLLLLSGFILAAARFLPLAVLGVGSTPLSREGGCGSVAPFLALCFPARLGSSSRKAGSGGSLPVTSTGSDETGLDSSRANLLSAGELLLLNLLLSLGLRVTVYNSVSFRLSIERCRSHASVI